MLLNVENLNVYYGAIHALQGISFNVDEGEIVTLIGANGAGKTTTLRTISGLLHPRTGSIRFKDEEITATSAEQIVELGIGQVPEGRKIFAPLTVRENLEMGAYTRTDAAGRREVAGARVLELPAPEGAPGPAGRDALRRRAADAGHRPGHDEPAHAAAAGRALHGPEPDPGGGDLQHHQGDQPAGHQHPAGGAERPHGAFRGPPRLRAGDRADRAFRRRPKKSPKIRRSRKLI